jgi:hypothetical protein
MHVVKYEGMYRLLGRPVLGYNGSLDLDSMSGSWKESQDKEFILRTQSCFWTLKGLNRHESTKMDA